MSRVARFRVIGLFEFASKPQIATVEVDRDSNLISVRPLRRRRTYVLPLSDVASMMVRGIIRTEVAEKKRLKKSKRARRGGGS